MFAITKVDNYPSLPRCPFPLKLCINHGCFFADLIFGQGFRGRLKNVYSVAVRAAERAKAYSYIGRKLKKREFRQVSIFLFVVVCCDGSQLWVQRINFGVREHGLGYSKFMDTLVKVCVCNTYCVTHPFQTDIQLNRKVLSELAVHEPRSFAALSSFVKSQLEQTRKGLKQLTIN